MSKKAKLYFLVLINLIAWGYVSYKIYGAIKGEDDIDFETSKLDVKKMDEMQKEDSVVLALNYPDPFLKGNGFLHKEKKQASSKDINISSVQNNKQVKHINTEVKVVVNDIKYVGLIKNTDKGIQTAIISINGISHFIKQKDNIDGHYVKDITPDYVLLLKGKELIKITK